MSRPRADAARARTTTALLAAFVAGCSIGVLGSMVGLGGAELRLPLLIGVFGFIALQAVILTRR